LHTHTDAHERVQECRVERREQGSAQYPEQFRGIKNGIKKEYIQKKGVPVCVCACVRVCVRGREAAYLCKKEEGLRPVIERVERRSGLRPATRLDCGSSPKKPPTISSSAPNIGVCTGDAPKKNREKRKEKKREEKKVMQRHVSPAKDLLRTIYRSEGACKVLQDINLREGVCSCADSLRRM
jgi:hypothetical protein